MAHKKARIHQSFNIRLSFYAVGTLLLSLGISLTIKAKNLGISPWDVLHYGLYAQFGFTFGTWNIIVGFSIVFISCIIRKMWPEMGTIFNMVMVGMFIDFFLYIIPDPKTLLMNYITLIVGIVIWSYGVGVYVTANFGAGPRDLLMLIITEFTKWKVQWTRIIIEVTVLIIGYFLGGPVGVGTVIISILNGYIIGISLPQSGRLLDYFIKRNIDNKKNYIQNK